MRNTLALLLSLGLAAPASAQRGFDAGKLTGAFGISLLNGQGGVNGRLAVEAGYELRRGLSAHLGTAIDYYHTRTVPVYLEVHQALSDKPRHFFAYAGGGMNLPWPLTDEGSMGRGWGMVTPVAYRGGLYTQTGIGRTLGRQTGRGFVIRLGHSFKSFTESYTEQVWQGSGWTEAPRSNRYGLGRLDITLQYML